MAVRLAVLATLFCVGCSAALPETAPVKEKEAGAKAANKEKPAAKKEAAETPAASSDKEAVAGGKEESKEKEEEIKGHVTVQCAPAQKRALAVTVDSLGRPELLPENLGSLTRTVEGHVHR